MRLKLLHKCLVLLAFLAQEIKCECVQTYATICDTLTDAYKNELTTTLADIVIQSPVQNEEEEQELNLQYLLVKFRYAYSLTVVGQKIKLTEQTPQAPAPCAVKYLTIRDSNLKKLKSGNFPSWLLLQKLSLSSNNINKIEISTFRNINFEEIDLSNNKIRSFEKRTFPDSLRVANVRRNELIYFHPEAFPSSLESLDLSYNQFSGNLDGMLNEMVNLRQLSLAYNRLFVVPNVTTLEKLEIFDLSHNYISTVVGSLFDRLLVLKFLNLDHNQIEHSQFLAKIICHESYNYLAIRLSFNLIKSVDLAQFTISQCSEFHRGRIFFTLFGNPWNCTNFQLFERYLSEAEWQLYFCDRGLFNSGVLPFCVSDGSDVQPDEFNEIVKNSREKVNCNLNLHLKTCDRTNAYRRNLTPCEEGYL